MAFVCGCAGKPPVTTDSAYQQIEPKAQLPERERADQLDNLVVKVVNVADKRYSYKNYVVLFINDRELKPPAGVHNMTSKYEYSMRLQEGVYDILAEYHIVGGWRDQVIKLLPDEPVKVLPNQRTVLEARLRKDGRGNLRESPPRFQLRYEPEPAAAIPQ